VSTGRLIAGGISTPQACRVGFVGPLTDDPDLLAAITDLVAVTLQG